MHSLRLLLLVPLMLLLATGCEEPFPNAGELEILNGLWGLPSKPPADPTNRLHGNAQAVALGKKLFMDAGLSSCGTVSCASCHKEDGLAFPEARAIGCGGQLTGRNAPGILNVASTQWLMWDGRADRTWNQPLLPLLNPAEMASSPAVLRARLAERYDGDYQGLFGKSPAAETVDEQLLANFGKVVGSYLSTLVRVQAPFDTDVRRFLEAEEAGTQESDPAYPRLKVFVRTGRCVGCHQGPTLSDNRFHVVGVEDASAGNVGAKAGVAALLASVFRGDGLYSDDREFVRGRLETLRREVEDKPENFEGAFRTPSLRNVALTAPFMHTGALATLEEVVEHYDQGGDAAGSYMGALSPSVHRLSLTTAEKAALVELLKSLTGGSVSGL
jgi:cytochrome c peroxidase